MIIRHICGAAIVCASVLLCSCRHPAAPLFTVLSPAATHVDFTNTLVDTDSLNILEYLNYYNGGGVAIGDINNDGLPDIYFTANSKGNNKLYLNKGHFRFEDITLKAGVSGDADWCTGATMADVNGDGLLDIYVCAVSGKLGLKGRNELYINNGNGTFTESAVAYGLDFSGFSTQTVFFDYDHDGYLDCFLLNQSDHTASGFGDTSGRRAFNPLTGDRLYHNNGPGKRFTDVTAASHIYSGPVGYGLGVAVADLNNDGWEDIYVGNDFHENDYYYINNHDGTFTESGAAHFNHYSRFSMGNDIADVNNDGQPDIVTADMLPADEKILKTYSSDEQPDMYNYKVLHRGFQNQYSRNCLQMNLGNGAAFSDVALMDGISATDWSWSPLLADFDNDGVKDLFVSNGIVKRSTDDDYATLISSVPVQMAMSRSHAMDKDILAQIPEGKVHNYIFRGASDGVFTDESAAWGMTVPSFSNGAAYADLDNDGNLDLVVNNIDDPATIYRNNGAHKNYLTVSFSGTKGNTFGIGCKLYLFHHGSIQYQQLMLTRGFESSSEPRLHFGLDTLSRIDSLLVVWPDQSYQLLKNLAVNRPITLKQNDAAGSFLYDRFFPPVRPLLTDVTDTIALPWRHRENTFNDFSRHPLIPHELSTAGPRLAVGDVNGDGLDDFYVCGAKGQPGALFIQTRAGRFVSSDTALFLADAACEDVDAVFFDANGDGHPDLYVVSGGNEYTGNNPALLDRLYLNDGHGHFTKAPDALPPIYANKSTVCVADIDHDGHPDLFIGGRADAAAYGLPQTSWLLIGDGKGHFSLAGTDIANLKNLGLVTSAAFADVNHDGWPDLIVAGEWMPVTLFINHQGQLVRDGSNLPSGLWQNIFLTDLNGDGNVDIIAGNYGLNSKLHATDEAPLKLYVGDINGTRVIDQIMTYSVDHREYTFLGKNDLEKRFPALKKQFPRYSDFAGKTVQEIFGDALDHLLVLNAQTLSSGIFVNDGKGRFTFHPFPNDAQVSPLFAFLAEDIDHDGKKDILCGGNLYGVLPYEGRYDGSFGTVLLGSGDGKDGAVERSRGRSGIGTAPYAGLSPVSSGFFIRGEVRDIKRLKTASGYLYAVARNNDSIRFFRPR